MSTFRLSIKTDNDAFEPDPAPELARILAELAAELNDGPSAIRSTPKRLHDINGNRVGEARFDQ